MDFQLPKGQNMASLRNNPHPRAVPPDNAAVWAPKWQKKSIVFNISHYMFVYNIFIKNLLCNPQAPSMLFYIKLWRIFQVLGLEFRWKYLKKHNLKKFIYHVNCKHVEFYIDCYFKCWSYCHSPRKQNV